MRKQSNRSPACRQAGISAFSLIELMIVTLIFTIIIGAAYSMMTTGTTNWHSGSVKIELQEDGRQVVTMMANELSESAFDKITIGAGGTSITFQVPVDETAGADRWEDTDADGIDDFFLENSMVAGNVQWGAYMHREDRTVSSAVLGFGNRVGRDIRFIGVGDEIHRRTLNPAGVVREDIIIADNIQDLRFIPTSQYVVTITMNSRKLTVEQHTINYPLETAVYLKN